MALSTLAASTMCSISSITTLSISSAASRLLRATERVEGAQVRRDRAVLQFDRRLQSSPQLIEVGDRGDVAVPPTRGDHWRSPRIAAAVRQARAARVSVGLDVPIVGMLPAPTMNRLR